MTQIDSGCTTQHVLPEKSISGSDLAKHDDVRDGEALSYLCTLSTCLPEARSHLGTASIQFPPTLVHLCI